MPNQFQRTQIPYSPLAVLPFSNRYDLTASQNEPINSDQLDGDFNYIIDSLNITYALAESIGAGILPGATNPTNVNKFPITDGANPATITWTQITSNYFSSQCVTTDAMALGSVTNGILAAACVGNDNIMEGAIQNNNITDNTLSFNIITDENNVHFQQFFNSQDEGTLDGNALSDGSVPASAIADGSLPGTKITTNTLPAIAIVNNSITNAQLSPVLQTPIGSMVDWTAPAGTPAPAGWFIANGQLLNRVTYAAVFALYGTTYGAGDGVTTFGTPDLRGRVVFCIDPASGQPTGGRIVNGTIAVGATGGEETHVLTTPEIPAHTHTYQNTIDNQTILANGGYGPRAQFGSITNSGSTGDGGAHNNMPPYMLIQKIIYAGV